MKASTCAIWLVAVLAAWGVIFTVTKDEQKHKGQIFGVGVAVIKDAPGGTILVRRVHGVEKMVVLEAIEGDTFLGWQGYPAVERLVIDLPALAPEIVVMAKPGDFNYGFLAKKFLVTKPPAEK